MSRPATAERLPRTGTPDPRRTRPAPEWLHPKRRVPLGKPVWTHVVCRRRSSSRERPGDHTPIRGRAGIVEPPWTRLICRNRISMSSSSARVSRASTPSGRRGNAATASGASSAGPTSAERGTGTLTPAHAATSRATTTLTSSTTTSFATGTGRTRAQSRARSSGIFGSSPSAATF